ncbi:hypothetical protein RKE29_20845 [Streptomyces sp. B1866]|uniref:hypothetical protein n=1 Tax=Streptomyces sp. B1866 TaxID=3075431 RepID=UPI00288E364C|nr:hypothetical protein [Streptomyces sp. B1866]MDT3399062.1 hypothetical protein [Streptomyces sp. B1866]
MGALACIAKWARGLFQPRPPGRHSWAYLVAHAPWPDTHEPPASTGHQDDGPPPDDPGDAPPGPEDPPLITTPLIRPYFVAYEADQTMPLRRLR